MVNPVHYALAAACMARGLDADEATRAYAYLRQGNPLLANDTYFAYKQMQAAIDLVLDERKGGSREHE